MSCGNLRNVSVNFPESLILFNFRNTLTCQKGKKKKEEEFKTNWRKQNFREIIWKELFKYQERRQDSSF